MWTLIAQGGEPFEGSAFEHPIHRIPALCVTTSGRVLVAHDVRQDWRDLPAEFDIALRTSDDRGLTWSAPRVLRRHSPGHGFGDASLTVDPATGAVHCWYVGSTGHSYFSATADAPGLELWCATSHDDGATWTHRDLSELRPAGVAGMFPASGNGTVLDDGTLVQPFVARIGEQNWAVCARSVDHGASWTMGEPVGPGCDESKVIGLGAGRVLMHARNRPNRMTCWSVDGARTFSTPIPTPELVEPACNGGLARVGGVLVASICDDPTQRRRLALHLSLDDGVSWSPPILVDSGAAAYSVLAALDDHTLIVVWEADDYQRILAATLSLDELGVVDGTWGAQAVTVTPRAGTPGAAQPPVVNPG